MAATEEESRRLAEELTNATNALSQFSGLLYGQSAEQLKATKADKDAKEAAALFAAKMDAASEAAKALAGVFVNYQKEVYKGGSANKAAAASIDAMGEAAKYAGVFLALLVPGGPLVKGLVAGIGLLTSELIKSGKLIAEQTDEIYKAYQDMAKAGAAGAGGMQDVFDSLQRVGLGTEKFAEYTKLVGENATDLAMFGGSVNKGRKIFDSTMASFSTNQRVEMEMMGLNRTAQAEATMAYIKQQRLLTSGTKAQMDTSSNAVEKYIKETDALTRITGANREEQQKILDEAMAEDIFGSFLDNMRSQGEEGVKKAEQIQNAIIMQQKMYGTQSAKGLRDSLTGFLGTSSENQKFFMSYGEGGQQLVNTLRDVNGTNDEMYNAMKAQAKSGKELNESMAGITGMGVAGDVFVAYKERRLAEQNFNKDLGKLFAEAAEERRKQLADPTTRKAAEAENNVRETQLAQQKAINQAMPSYIDSSLSASKANLALAEAALAAAEALFGVAGKKKDTKITGKKLAETAGKNAAANEVKSGRIGPEEAKAVLENGSERDIKDFGGREALEKIAGSMPAPAPVDIAKIDKEIERFTKRNNMSLQANKDYVEKLQKQKGSATPAAGPAPAAPAPASPTAAKTATGASGAATAKPSPRPPEGSDADTGAEKVDLTKILKFTSKSGSQQNFEGLNETFKNAVIAAATEYNKLTGGMLQINSAKRDPEDQQRLWDESVAAGRTGKTASGMPIGKPGRSLHERGEAVDIQNYQDPAAVAALAKYGLTQKVPSDPVHFQAKDGGVVPPLPGGSTVLAGEAGQAEAIIPLKNGAVPVTMPKDFVEGMSKYNLITEMLTDKFAENNVSASAKQELEDIKSRAMSGTGTNGDAMLTAFNQLGAELKAQGEANRSLFEAMLRGQTTSNDIQNKMLRYTQN